MSGAIEDRRQTAPMLAFPLDGATHSRKRLGERKDLGRDGDFWHQIGPRKRHALCSGTAQRNAADDSVRLANLASIEKATELLGLVVTSNTRCQSYAEPFCLSAFDAL